MTVSMRSWTTALGGSLALLALTLAAVFWAAGGSGAAAGVAMPGPHADGAAMPAAHDVAGPDTITMEIPAGLTLIGWFGVPTSSETILANNAGIESVFSFEAGAFAADSAALPPDLRTPFDVDRGDGLFLSAPAATTLVVPMRVAQTEDITYFESAPATPSPDLGMPTGGTATLTRTADDVTVQINAMDLVPGDAYSVWWVIFNNWELCTDGECGLDDVMTAAGGDTSVGITVMHATGAVAEADGSASMNARLVLGELGDHQVLFGDGLASLMDSEIHFVIRTHGPALTDPDEVAQQISTFQFGCTPESSLDLGSGDFGCFDAQDAIFMAPGR